MMKQYSSWKRTVGTTKKSIAAISGTWFSRNVRQVWEGGLRCRHMYFTTVDWSTVYGDESVLVGSGVAIFGAE